MYSQDAILLLISSTMMRNDADDDFVLCHDKSLSRSLGSSVYCKQLMMQLLATDNRDVHTQISSVASNQGARQIPKVWTQL